MALDHQVFRIFYYIPSLSLLWMKIFCVQKFSLLRFLSLSLYNVLEWICITLKQERIQTVYVMFTKLLSDRRFHLYCLFFLPFTYFIYVFMCAHMYVNVLWCIWKDQSTIFWSQFSPPTRWVLRIKLRMSSLVPSSLPIVPSHWPFHWFRDEDV